jgi:hypothetical protein
LVLKSKDSIDTSGSEGGGHGQEFHVWLLNSPSDNHELLDFNPELPLHEQQPLSPVSLERGTRTPAAGQSGNSGSCREGGFCIPADEATTSAQAHSQSETLPALAMPQCGDHGSYLEASWSAAPAELAAQGTTVAKEHAPPAQKQQLHQLEAMPSPCTPPKGQQSAQSPAWHASLGPYAPRSCPVTAQKLAYGQQSPTLSAIAAFALLGSAGKRCADALRNSLNKKPMEASIMQNSLCNGLREESASKKDAAPQPREAAELETDKTADERAERTFVGLFTAGGRVRTKHIADEVERQVGKPPPNLYDQLCFLSALCNQVIRDTHQMRFKLKTAMLLTLHLPELLSFFRPSKAMHPALQVVQKQLLVWAVCILLGVLTAMFLFSLPMILATAKPLESAVAEDVITASDSSEGADLRDADANDYTSLAWEMAWPSHGQLDGMTLAFREMAGRLSEMVRTAQQLVFNI